MIGQLLEMTPSEQDDEGKVEDLFRRAVFNWVQSTKRLVASSNALGPNTRVAYSALADIKHARDMLDSLFVPVVAKVPANFADQAGGITAEDVKSTVVSLTKRIATAPFNEVRKTPFNARHEPSIAPKVQAHVDDIMGAPPIVRTEPDHAGQSRLDPPARPEPSPSNGAIGCWPPVDGWDGQSIVKTSPVTLNIPENSAPIHLHQVGDLSAPVYPKNGKALWAGIDCPSCPAKVTERCKKDDGTILPKPHTKRKNMAEAAVAQPVPVPEGDELKLWTT